MEIDQLRTYLAVLEAGSFSRAAGVLHIGQSTVSFHIKALETAVGSRLLDRQGRLRPTAAGRVLLRYAQRIVGLREEALARVRGAESGESGEVVIAASSIPGEYLLPSLIARFIKSHPRVAVTLGVASSQRALASLLAQECDLAVVGTRVRDKRVTALPIAADEVVLVGAPARAGKRRWNELRLIVREEGSGTRAAAAALLTRFAADTERPPPVQVGSTEAAKQCAIAGVGLALVSRRAVHHEIEAGLLVNVPAPGLPIRRAFFAARLRSATPSAAARAFWDLVQKNR